MVRTLKVIHNRYSKNNTSRANHTLKRNKMNNHSTFTGKSTLEGSLFLMPVTSKDIIKRIKEKTHTIHHLEHMTDSEWITHVTLKVDTSRNTY